MPRRLGRSLVFLGVIAGNVDAYSVGCFQVDLGKLPLILQVSSITLADIGYMVLNTEYRVRSYLPFG